MPEYRRNIVQIEPFHVDFSKTFVEMLTECCERLADYAPIRSGIRFFDDDNGTITKIALRLAEEIKRADPIDWETADVGTILAQDTLRNRLLRKVARIRGGHLRVRLRTAIVTQIETAIRTSADVAIEQNDHSFRVIRPDEAHELLETVRGVKKMWIFIFTPNALLADSNHGIVHIQ